MFSGVFDHLAREGSRHSASRLIEAWLPVRSVRLLDDIAYGPNPRQRLDLYLPREPLARSRLVVFLYGGCWTAGARRDYRFLALALGRHGFAVAVPDYRLFPEAGFPDFLVDTASAIGWLNRHAAGHGIEGERLVLIGHSAGAYNAAMVALDRTYLAQAGVTPEIVAGVVGLAGPYAFNPLEYQETRKIFAPFSHAPDRVQPLRLVRAQAPPMLLVHGGADRRVLPVNSARFAAAMRAAGNRVDLRVYPRHSHVGLLLSLASPIPRLSGLLDEIVGFLNQTLECDRVAG